MFPEITRDEVFRIETPRLWLRWPALADADALAVIVARTCSDAGAPTAYVDPDDMTADIVRWRSEMEAGTALHLVLAPKTGTRRPIGLVHSGQSVEVDCGLPVDPTLGAEATRAVRDMTILLGVRTSIRRGPLMAH